MALSANQITAVYQALYGRNPTQAELNTAAAIDQNFGDQAVVDSLVQSGETHQFDDPVYLIIKSATNVVPTTAQLSAWVNFLETTTAALVLSGQTATAAFVTAETQMTNAFAQNPFFTNLYGPGSATITVAVATKIISNTQAHGGALNAQQQSAAQVWGTTGLTTAQVFAQFATNDASIAANQAEIDAFLTKVADDAAGIPANTFTLTQNIDTFTTAAKGAVFNALPAVTPLGIAVNTLQTGDNLQDTANDGTLNFVTAVQTIGANPPFATGVILNGIATATITGNAGALTGFAGNVTGLLTVNDTNSIDNVRVGAVGQGLKTLLTNINVSGYAGAGDEAFTAVIATAAVDLTKTINISLTGTNLGTTAAAGAFEITIANDTVAGGTAANPNNTYGTWSITANNNTNLVLDQDTGEGVGGATGLTLAGAGNIAVGQEAAGDWQLLKTIDATATKGTVFLTGATSGTGTQARASATNPGWLFGAGAGLLNDTGAGFNLTSVLLGSGMTFLDVSSASVAQVTALKTDAGAGVTVNAGNEIIVKNSVATTISTATFANIKGFSALGIGGATAADGAGGVINMTNLPATINTIDYITAASAGVSITNPVATLTLNTFDNGKGNQLTVGAVGPQAAGTFTLNVGDTFHSTAGAVGTAVPLHTAGVRIIGEQNVNINSVGANGNVVGLVALSRSGGVGAENVAIGGNKNLTIGVTGDGAIFDIFPSQATNTPPITAVTNSLQITITNTGTTTFLSSANTAAPGFGDLIVPGDSVHGPGGPAVGGGFPLTTSTNAVSIDATASGGLIMQGGDFNYTPSLSVAGSIGDSILGSTTGANVLGGSIGNDVLQALSINAANTIFTGGGGDAVTLGVGHVVGDNVDIYFGFSTAGITPGQAEVVRFQSITASNVAAGTGDIPQLGWFNQATAATATGYGGATAATSTYAGLGANQGTAGDVTTVTNFNPAIDLLTLSDGNSGYQVGGPTNAFGGAVRGLVEGNLSGHTTAAGATGTAAVLQVLTGGTIPSAGNSVNATTDLIELEGHTYSSATAVANELATDVGSQIFFTNGAAMTANTSGHIYMAWSDFSNQIHIADAAWIDSSGAHAAGAVLPSLAFTWHISELATLPNVSITGLNPGQDFVHLMHN